MPSLATSPMKAKSHKTRSASSASLSRAESEPPLTRRLSCFKVAHIPAPHHRQAAAARFLDDESKISVRIPPGNSIGSAQARR